MDKARKTFLKLSPELQERFAVLFRAIEADQLRGLDVRKLYGTKDTFRVRVGEWRIVFVRDAFGVNRITRFGHRNEKTYRDV